jgi:hypothetical protein
MRTTLQKVQREFRKRQEAEEKRILRAEKKKQHQEEIKTIEEQSDGNNRNAE